MNKYTINMYTCIHTYLSTNHISCNTFD